MKFNATRFVQVITLIGNSKNNYDESKNWYVTVGINAGASITKNTLVGQYVTSSPADYDSFGKEIVAQTYGTSVGIFRNDTKTLSFTWIGIFTTGTDCSTGLFDWSRSEYFSSRLPLNISSYTISSPQFATIGGSDCLV